MIKCSFFFFKDLMFTSGKFKKILSFQLSSYEVRKFDFRPIHFFCDHVSDLPNLGNSQSCPCKKGDFTHARLPFCMSPNLWDGGVFLLRKSGENQGMRLDNASVGAREIDQEKTGGEKIHCYSCFW